MTATKPKKVIKLAAQGQVRGFTPPGTLDADYDEAAQLAKANPKHPVIVHEHTFEDTAAAREKMRVHLAGVARLQMAALNAEAIHEPYHVGYSLDPTELLYRTFVTYYPDGRPVRSRKPKSEAIAGPNDPPPPPEDDPDAPRATLSGSGFVYPPAPVDLTTVVDDGHTATMPVTGNARAVNDVVYEDKDGTVTDAEGQFINGPDVGRDHDGGEVDAAAL